MGIDGNIMIEVLKAQRNAALDALAMSEAKCAALKSELDKAPKIMTNEEVEAARG